MSGSDIRASPPQTQSPIRRDAGLNQLEYPLVICNRPFLRERVVGLMRIAPRADRRERFLGELQLFCLKRGVP
jgi:hypothetical protein